MPTILVADDNSNIQKMVSLVFKEKGIHVVAVGNGEAACRKVPEVRPDVVLADVFMPVRNGYEVCEFVKQDPQFAETPVILLVGAFDPLDEKEAQRVGANGVLKKPFVPPEPLIAMVSSLLKIESPAEEPQPRPAPEEASKRSPVESGPTARQLAIASAQAQYVETNEDDAVTTLSAPVAVPSSQALEIEEEEVDAEPASEWAKRRASMDYEIDAAESADMVERLAAQGAVEEPEIQVASKHLPFGGANIPGMSGIPGESAQEAPPAAASETIAEAMPSTQNTHRTYEFSVPAEIEKETETPFDAGIPPELKHETVFEFDSPAPAFSAPEPVPAEESPIAEAQDAIDAAPIQTLPEIDAAQPPVDNYVRTASQSLKPFHEIEKIISLPEETSASRLLKEKPASRSSVFSEEADPAVAEQTPLNVTAVEGGPEQTASKPVVDQATVDDVVAKVISKLEPQLHKALANGVLRPLVEELLNQQREKK